jgi:hypothetical protein
MKKSFGSDRNLESFKVFPYVAWALIILFTFIVYHITVNLRLAAADLKAQTEFTHIQSQMDPTKIKNFEKPQPKQAEPAS